MERREFLRLSSAGAVGMLMPINLMVVCRHDKKRQLKNWAWITTDLKASTSDWQKLFAQLQQAGIDAILPEIFDSRRAYYASQHLPVGGEWLEKILPLAKQEGLEVHAWMWTMPCNIPKIHEKHPEWFMINRKHVSCLTKPAYVDYYKFLCPSRQEVHEFLQRRVQELSAFEALDGIHLDYIRYPDVVIAAALQPRYGISQDREYPEYDYCYCDVCRAQFRAQHGVDPLELEDPSTNDAWRQFRYDRITSLVNDRLLPLAHRHGKKLTAAVFPNWEAVRQQWMNWQLDGFMPMLYHNFYYGDISWIRAQTEKGVQMLAGRSPLFSGLFVPKLDPDELERAIKGSLAAGASGICLFHANALSGAHWRSLTGLKRSGVI